MVSGNVVSAYSSCIAAQRPWYLTDALLDESIERDASSAVYHIDFDQCDPHAIRMRCGQHGRSEKKAGRAR